MDKYEQTAQTWNGLAKIYEEKFMHLNLYDESYDVFAALVNKEDANIFETGSGPGNIAYYMLGKHPGWKWLGTDVAPAMIDLAKANNPTANFEVMDSREIGSIDQKFDGIISGFCIPFLSQEDCCAYFKDCCNLLNDKGLLYLSFMEGNYEDSTYKTGSTGQQVFFHYHPWDIIKQQLNTAGFGIEKIFKVQYQRNGSQKEEHTVLIANKI